MKEKRMNIGYVMDQLVAEVMAEMQEVMDAKSYNLNVSLLKRAVQQGVSRGLEEGLNLSAYYTPARFRPGFSIRKQS